MLSLMFPSLYQFGVESINFSDVVVSKSSVNPQGCVIIKARKPIQWILDHCAINNIELIDVERLDFKFNTDNSLSLIDKTIVLG